MILDLSAGKRAIWVDKLAEDVIFVDLRPEMIPTVLCDTRNLPFKDGTFSLVVFDPPHMVHGEGSDMAKQYSRMTADEIRDLIRRTSREAYRVSTEGAYLCFKWNSHDVRLDHILTLMPGWLPLFGHNFKAGKRGQTSWTLLRKRVSSYQTGSQMGLILSNLQSEDQSGKPEA